MSACRSRGVPRLGVGARAHWLHIRSQRSGRRRGSWGDTRSRSGASGGLQRAVRETTSHGHPRPHFGRRAHLLTFRTQKKSSPGLASGKVWASSSLSSPSPSGRGTGSGSRPRRAVPHRSLCLLPPPPRHRPHHRLPPLQLRPQHRRHTRSTNRCSNPSPTSRPRGGPGLGRAACRTGSP